MNLKKGDRYIHYTKRGGVNKGVVKEITKVNALDTNNQCRYTKYYLLSENNISYSLDGDDGKFYRMDKEYTKEESEQLDKTIKDIIDKNSKKKEKLSNILPKNMNGDVTLSDVNLDDVIKNKFDSGK